MRRIRASCVLAGPRYDGAGWDTVVTRGDLWYIVERSCASVLAPVAQRIERWPPEPKVGGSKPSWCAIYERPRGLSAGPFASPVLDLRSLRGV